MGYSIQQRDQSFFVPHSRLPAMVASIQDLAGQETIRDGSGYHFSWVEQGFDKHDDPNDILRAWRWSPEFDDRGNIDTIYFNGEKLGDCNMLFEAIAPYVKAGSYIEMTGEDGARWRWCFDGTTMTEKTAKVTW